MGASASRIERQRISQRGEILGTAGSVQAACRISECSEGVGDQRGSDEHIRRPCAVRSTVRYREAQGNGAQDDTAERQTSVGCGVEHKPFTGIMLEEEDK